MLNCTALTYAQKAATTDDKGRVPGVKETDHAGADETPTPPGGPPPDVRATDDVEVAKNAGVGSDLAYASRSVVEVGGVLAFTHQSKTTEFRLSPSVGYFFIDNLELTLFPELVITRIARDGDEAGEGAQTDWSIGAVLEPSYHMPFNDRLFAFAGLGVGLNYAEDEPTLLAELAAHAGADFFLVDEGPGQSGSSLTCVARGLRELGIPAQRIVFLPSYSCDGTDFVNEAARATWAQHAHFSSDFDAAWLKRVVPGAELCDLSAGSWRSWLGHQAWGMSCIPRHERRKFVAKVGGQDTLMLRFAGFGEHGERVRARAELLQQSGVTPRTYKLQHGMLVLQHLPGRQLTRGAVTAELLRTVATYLAFRREKLGGAELAAIEPLVEMARFNITQALGSPACRPLSSLASRASSVAVSATVVDGHLLPQEWLTTAAGLKKLDAFDHGDDHFYPGPCDIAWDVAGAGAELGLSTANRRGLASLYARAASDASIQLRLPFFEIAYLAHRVGYMTSVAKESPAGVEQSALRDRYTNALAARLAEHAR